jgi:hypothetical protein
MHLTVIRKKGASIVNKTEPIFDLLKSIRMEAMTDGNWGLLRAVVKAENAATTEICGVNTQADGVNYDKVMNEVFPYIEAKLV